MALALQDLVETWRSVSGTRSRNAKTLRLAECLRRASPSEAALVACYLTGELPQGRIGLGPATVHEVRTTAPAVVAALDLEQVDRALTALAAVRGAGSAERRSEQLRTLFAQATANEQEFLIHLLMGELRQGALDGLMAEAIANAHALEPDRVRRALMLSGSLAKVAEAATQAGEAGLAQFGLRLFQPLQPMLAQTAEDPADALAQLGTAAFEYKLDGARIQAHRSGDDVRIFTRNLNDVTSSLPDVVSAVLAIPAGEFILDGEAIAMRADGSPQPFQVTMRRFGRKLDVDTLKQEIPLHCLFFDCLALDGQTLIDRPTAERVHALEATVPQGMRMARLVTADILTAEAFLARAMEAGHEGIMAKALDAPYDAGARGGSWLKIKPVHTLDLVVLAAEWGHGRRHGWLSNLHLGARDEAGGFVMLGKTFKGLTDEMLTWQTRALLEREVERDHHTVYVRPELVVEIAFNDVQSSPRYPGGLALRFARVKAYRPDKSAGEADTIDTVRDLWRKQVARDGESK